MSELLAGRYRLGPVIGSGGMASVHEAEDMSLGRKVAVKVMHPRFASDEKSVARFDREARAIASLSHPGIVDVYDVGRDDGTYFIVMQLIAGRSVKDLVRDGPLTVDRTIDIGIQVAKALSHAHKAGVVHRDVKSHNILLAADGAVKLVDFGIATGDGQPVTDGGILGTVHYVAPEQAKGEPGTAASDIYSLGVVLYEMATGRLPFEGQTAVDIATQHVSSAPLPPSQVKPDLPRSLERAILHALEKDPSRRPRSGDDLARELLAFDDLAEQETRLVTPIVTDVSSGARVQRVPMRTEPRSDPWPLVLLAIVAVLLVAGLLPLWSAVLQGGRI